MPWALAPGDDLKNEVMTQPCPFFDPQTLGWSPWYQQPLISPSFTHLSIIPKETHIFAELKAKPDVPPFSFAFRYLKFGDGTLSAEE